MQIEVHLSFSTDVLPKMISVISCYQMKTFFNLRCCNCYTITKNSKRHWPNKKGVVVLWRRGVVVITTAQLHATKPELRFRTGSNPAHGGLEIRDGEDLWQWSRLGIRLNAFRRSNIPQKQFIIIKVLIKLYQSFKRLLKVLKKADTNLGQCINI